MVFKGTERAPPTPCAPEMDSVAGMIDALTSKEQLLLQSKFIDELPANRVCVSPTLVLGRKFDSEDVKKETPGVSKK